MAWDGSNFLCCSWKDGGVQLLTSNTFARCLTQVFWVPGSRLNWNHVVVAWLQPLMIGSLLCKVSLLEPGWYLYMVYFCWHFVVHLSDLLWYSWRDGGVQLLTSNTFARCLTQVFWVPGSRLNWNHVVVAWLQPLMIGSLLCKVSLLEPGWYLYMVYFCWHFVVHLFGLQSQWLLDASWTGWGLTG